MKVVEKKYYILQSKDKVSIHKASITKALCIGVSAKLA